MGKPLHISESSEVGRERAVNYMLNQMNETEKLK